jgi:hypothetical protein
MVISKRMRWKGHVTPVTELRIAYKILFGRPSGGPSCRWENYFSIKEKECESMDWVCLLQHKDKWRPVVHTVMNCKVA